MKIPKQFRLGGVNWTVQTGQPIEAMGFCQLDKALIKLNDDIKGEVLEQTFAHELVHSIMFSMGLRDHDEKFVDCFGTFLHQYLSQWGK
jgi:predicted SprT family Zn-dependent metalloprotease